MGADETKASATAGANNVGLNPLRARLSLKDVEVLDLLVAHHSNKEIARALGLSEKTVEGRLRALKTKLGTKDRNDTARVYAGLAAPLGKTLEGFPEMSGEAWPDLAEGQEGSRPDPLLLNDVSPLGDGAARRARGGLRPDLGVFPERSVLASLLMVAAIVAFLGLAFLAVVAMVRDLVSNGLPGFLN